MSSELAYVPELVGINYLSYKKKTIDILRSMNLWHFVKGEQSKPTDAKDIDIWEDRCDQARGLIGKIVSDS